MRVHADQSHAPHFIVVSELAIIELVGFVSEAVLREHVAATAGSHVAKKIGWKDARARITRLEKMAREGPHSASTKSVLSSLAFNPVFLAEHLPGFIQPPTPSISPTDVDRRKRAVELAYIQVGLADIFHLEAAKGLGCEVFVTNDSDFLDLAALVQELYGLEVKRPVQFAEGLGEI